LEEKADYIPPFSTVDTSKPKKKKKKKKKKDTDPAQDRTLPASDVLSALENQYENIGDVSCSESDGSDGLGRSVDIYTKVIEDTDENELKSKYRKNPQFSSEINAYFSTMSEEERARMILELATETIDEKIETVQEQGVSNGSRREEKNMDLLPEDTTVIYKNANSNYNGLYSDDVKLMTQKSGENIVPLRTLEGRSEVMSDITLHAPHQQNNNISHGDGRGHESRGATNHARNDLILPDESFPDEFNATTTQLLVKRKH